MTRKQAKKIMCFGDILIVLSDDEIPNIYELDEIWEQIQVIKKRWARKILQQNFKRFDFKDLWNFDQVS